MATAAQIGRQLRAALSQTISDAMRLAVENLVAATPVDTGHARSNWVFSVNQPYQGVDGSRTAVSTAKQDEGLALLDRYDVGKTPRTFIRNNVDYVKYLDEGWSPQAPAGFVAQAINAAASSAPYGKKGAVRKLLRGLARAAIIRRGRRRARSSP